jgi:hypothetical protein
MTTAWRANLIYQEEYCFLESRVVWYVVTKVPGEPAAFNVLYTYRYINHIPAFSQGKYCERALFIGRRLS